MDDRKFSGKTAICNNKSVKKDEFIIFADVPPIPTDERLKKYREAGFTYYNLTEDYVVRDGENGITEEYYSAIDRAKKAGLKVMLRTMRNNSPDYYDNITDEFDGKADAFYFADEPSFEYVSWYGNNTLGGLNKFVEWHNRYAENSFFHINLLQSYGMKIVHGKDMEFYKKYVDTYIKDVLINVKGEKSLSTDHYPLSFDENGNHIKETVLFDYFLISSRARDLRSAGHDVRTCFCIQLVSDKGLKMRLPTCAEDIAFQVNLALAFGAKALEYYLYCGVDCGLITDRKTQKNYSPVYDWVKSANKGAEKLGKVLLGCEWTGAKTFKGESVCDEHNARAFETSKEFEKESFAALCGFKSSADAIVSEFKYGNGYCYMALNYSEPTSGTCNTVNFRLKSGFSAKIVSLNGNKSVKSEDEEISVTLGAGEAALLLAEPATL